MLPTIGITSGDPAGIGLEVLLKSIPPLLQSANWILYTSRGVFEANRTLFAPDISHCWLEGSDLPASRAALWLKAVDRNAGTAEALTYLAQASDDVLSGRIAAIVTGPVSKAAIGPAFRG